MNETVAQVIEVIVENRRRFEEFCYSLSNEQLGRGVLIAESIFPNAAFEDGRGINTLTGADAIAPFGGAAFHDNKVWVKRAGL